MYGYARASLHYARWMTTHESPSRKPRETAV
jgi:hypothetical protein